MYISNVFWMKMVNPNMMVQLICGIEERHTSITENNSPSEWHLKVDIHLIKRAEGSVPYSLN